MILNIKSDGIQKIYIYGLLLFNVKNIWKPAEKSGITTIHFM